jgi:peptide deformylase
LAEPHFSDAKEIVKENGWGKDGLSWLPGKDNLEG